MSQIVELLPKVSQDIGYIVKGGFNKEQKYHFRSIDQVLDAIAPVLWKHGMTVTHKVLEFRTTTDDVSDSEKKRYRYNVTTLLEVTFHAPDGSTLSCSSIGGGMDTNGDKAASKSMAQSFKYALLLGLTIPVGPKAIQDSDQSERRPKSEPSSFDQATAAISKAKDVATLRRYVNAAKQKFQEADLQALLNMGAKREEELNGLVV